MCTSSKRSRRRQGNLLVDVQSISIDARKVDEPLQSQYGFMKDLLFQKRSQCLSPENTGVVIVDDNARTAPSMHSALPRRAKTLCRWDSGAVTSEGPTRNVANCVPIRPHRTRYEEEDVSCWTINDQNQQDPCHPRRSSSNSPMAFPRADDAFELALRPMARY